MSANKAKYLLTLAGNGPENYRVTGFAGEDAIGSRTGSTLMPSRFMLLYGADDDGLMGQGNIDDHTDRFKEKEEEHKISVVNLRKGLKILGYDVEEDGPLDLPVYHAFLQYHWDKGRVKLTWVYPEEDDAEKTMDAVAEKYWMFTWKTIKDEYDGVANHVLVLVGYKLKNGNIVELYGIDNADRYTEFYSSVKGYKAVDVTSEVDGDKKKIYKRSQNKDNRSYVEKYEYTITQVRMWTEVKIDADSTVAKSIAKRITKESNGYSGGLTW